MSEELFPQDKVSEVAAGESSLQTPPPPASAGAGGGPERRRSRSTGTPPAPADAASPFTRPPQTPPPSPAAPPASAVAWDDILNILPEDDAPAAAVPPDLPLPPLAGRGGRG